MSSKASGNDTLLLSYSMLSLFFPSPKLKVIGSTFDSDSSTYSTTSLGYSASAFAAASEVYSVLIFKKTVNSSVSPH